MKIENQVCTLEQAKRLKELGVEQKSAFIHIFYVDDLNLQTFEKSYRHEAVFTNWNIDAFKKLEWYSAFTVAELFVMNDEEFTVCENYCHDLAKRIAGRLITRLENNLITAEEVNKRLQQ